MSSVISRDKTSNPLIDSIFRVSVDAYDVLQLQILFGSILFLSDDEF